MGHRKYIKSKRLLGNLKIFYDIHGNEASENLLIPVLFQFPDRASQLPKIRSRKSSARNQRPSPRVVLVSQ